jgi:hypothetical protein
MNVRSLLGLMLAMAVLGAGCGDDGGNGGMEDAGNGTGDGGGNGEDFPVARVDADNTDPMNTGTEADYSCMGSRTAPSGGDSAEFTLTLTEFRSGNAVEGACVRFYSDNMVPMSDSCGSGSGATTDQNGQITVSSPTEGWYAYRVFGSEDTDPALVPTVQINELAPASGGGSVEATAVSSSTANLIAIGAGIRRGEGTGFVAGTIYDCTADSDSPKPVWGTEIRIADSEGNYIEEGGGTLDPNIFYFNGEEDSGPDTEQPYTNTDGLYAAVNLPMDGNTTEFFVEAWGRPDADSDMQVVACEKIRVFADGGALLNMGPVRSDGPSCPGLQ